MRPWKLRHKRRPQLEAAWMKGNMRCNKVNSLSDIIIKTIISEVGTPLMRNATRIKKFLEEEKGPKTRKRMNTNQGKSESKKTSFMT